MPPNRTAKIAEWALVAQTARPVGSGAGRVDAAFG